MSSSKKNSVAFTPSNYPTVKKKNMNQSQYNDKQVKTFNIERELQMNKSLDLAVENQLYEDHWRQKYEQQSQQMIQLKNTYEMEIRSLRKEVHQLSNLFNDMDRNRSISTSNSSQLYEKQIQKMRDIIEDKTVQINQLQTQIERQKAGQNDSQARLRNEVEQLKKHLSFVQLEHQEELKLLRDKLEHQKDMQYNNIKTNYTHHNEILLSENEKLRSLINIKNAEINTLLEQNSGYKQQYEKENDDYRVEIIDLRNYICQLEQDHSKQIDDLTLHYQKQINNEIAQLKTQSEQQRNASNNDILRLQEIVDQKNQELEVQIIEKGQIKQNCDQNIKKLLEDIDYQKTKYIQLENEKNKQLNDFNNKYEKLIDIKDKQEHSYQQQIDQLNNDILLLQGQLQQSNEEIQQQMKQMCQQKNDFEDTIIDFKHTIQLSQLEKQELEQSKNQEIDEFKLLIKDQETNYKESIKQKDLKINHMNYEINKLNEICQNKNKECENLQLAKLSLHQKLTKIINENDKLLETLNLFEKQKNLEIEELRCKMDSGAAYQFENLKSAYNTQIGILKDQIEELHRQLTIQQSDIYNHRQNNYTSRLRSQSLARQ